MSSWNPGGDLDLRGSAPAASTSKATKKKSKAAQDKADKEEVKRRSSKGEARVQVRHDRVQQAHIGMFHPACDQCRKASKLLAGTAAWDLTNLLAQNANALYIQMVKAI